MSPLLWAYHTTHGSARKLCWTWREPFFVFRYQSTSQSLKEKLKDQSKLILFQIYVTGSKLFKRNQLASGHVNYDWTNWNRNSFPKTVCSIILLTFVSSNLILFHMVERFYGKKEINFFRVIRLSWVTSMWGWPYECADVMLVTCPADVIPSSFSPPPCILLLLFFWKTFSRSILSSPFSDTKFHSKLDVNWMV